MTSASCSQSLEQLVSWRDCQSTWRFLIRVARSASESSSMKQFLLVILRHSQRTFDSVSDFERTWRKRCIRYSSSRPWYRIHVHSGSRPLQERDTSESHTSSTHRRCQSELVLESVTNHPL